LMLDCNDLEFSGKITFTFVEPFADRLKSLLREADQDHRIHESRCQDVPLEVFSALQDGDILFIDSSHVSKVGSDVNDQLFRILPALAPGVFVHFHDIFWPFEYPPEW